MFTLLRESAKDLRLATLQVFSLGVAFLIAESFYRFGSFGLELLAFLATWGVVDALVTGLHQGWRRLRS